MNPINKKGFIIVCGPSGAGKSTLIERVTQEIHHITATISYTTRLKRDYEIHGKNYFFISEEEFFKKEKNGDFVEWAKVYNDYYATAKDQVQAVWNSGKSIIKDVDLQGLQSIKKLYPHSLSVGIFAPSSEEANDRIRKREADSTSIINIRKGTYQKEMEQLYQLAEVKIINDELEKAYIKFKKEIETYIHSI